MKEVQMSKAVIDAKGSRGRDITGRQNKVMGVSLRIHALVPLASLLCCSSLALVTINAVSSSPASSTSSSSSYSSSSESPSISFKNPLDQDGFTRALKSIKSNRAVEPKKLPRQPHVLSVTEGKSMSSKKWSFPWPGEQRKSLAPSSKTGIRAGEEYLLMKSGIGEAYGKTDDSLEYCLALAAPSIPK
ncbi:unnamed protein product [Notodromas monacha]|uniref:Uncharacterized protein n=1 Tax=Notodromas monacha TaxID=399045 RepID=A0A7R9BP15_9CRUS|nr:unnamed protein product [Notodromas monacha]CAG0918738.1 unnamed protein product [Notodromas monacha]